MERQSEGECKGKKRKRQRDKAKVSERTSRDACKETGKIERYTVIER
jgi:hypothetical protein